MKAAVREAFHRFSTPLEGRCYHLYLDVKKLPTTGVGNLVATLPEVRALPWKRPDGTDASPDEVIAMYATVKAHEELAPAGGMAFAKLTTLRLTDEGVDALVERRLTMNHALLSRSFDDLDEWPADAQLFIHSWAWAVGPAARYPSMFAALRRGDFIAASAECIINPQIGTIVERNRRNRILLWNAATVVQDKLDRDVVYWPRGLVEEARRAAIKEAPTLPELEDPISEDDGGASRRDATLDTVEHPFDGEK